MVFIIFAITFSQIISSKGFQVFSVNDLIQLIAEYFAVCSLGYFHLDLLEQSISFCLLTVLLLILILVRAYHYSWTHCTMRRKHK